MRLEREFAYWQSAILSLSKPKIPVLPYVPLRRQPPQRSIQVDTAWDGLQDILADIIERFQVDTSRCLEFGVDYGFSTVALSSFFDSVVGVDTFLGDCHAGGRADIYAETVDRLSQFPNIQLVQSDYREFINQDHGTLGLIHVDIIHTFADTFVCGLWSAQHSQCTIFHDTESFPPVKQAVSEIARATGKTFHNFPECYGLGILV